MLKIIEWLFRRKPAARADAKLSGDDRILWGVVANAGRLSDRPRMRWAHVMDATGLGSQSSIALCQRFGYDPDEMCSNGRQRRDEAYDSGVVGMSKQRRAKLRASAPGVLASHGVLFKSNNAGAHLIIHHGGKIVDFWPGAGKFMFRGDSKAQPCDVHSLLGKLGVINHSKSSRK